MQRSNIKEEHRVELASNRQAQSQEHCRPSSAVPHLLGPHSLELAVQRQLLALPDVRFPRLVVRRLPDGVLLEGVVEISSEEPDFDTSVRAIAGVETVLNHLVKCRCGTPPKG